VPALLTSPFIDRPGAVAAEGVDAGIVAHYGDPFREQKLLEEGLATVDLGNTRLPREYRVLQRRSEEA
jgi:hypothetical protein